MFDRGKQPEYEMDLENRFVAPEMTENDRDNEFSLRPRTLEEYIGQEQVKENLSVFMQAARLRSEPLDHVLLYGPPGLGKTTLSQIIAAEMGVNIRITSGPAIEKPGDLAALLTNLNENDILFIDEIHRLNRSVEEVLYPAMEDYALDIIIGKGPAPAPFASTCPASPWWAPPPVPVSFPHRCGIASVSCSGWSFTRRRSFRRSLPAPPVSSAFPVKPRSPWSLPAAAAARPALPTAF